ncbi:MAG: hypothetical protein GXO89_17200 [Chlorobi bacterium]|nr:hypothetical protein [Chlorobiota bacterium]
MKTVVKITIGLFLFLYNVNSYSQSPGYFKYQAVLRDNTGVVMDNQTVSLKIEILKNNENGVVEYAEVHTDTTNTYGLVLIEIGSGTTLSGDFSSIDWGSDIYFLGISLDETGGGAYELMGVSQLLSVPYALYSSKSGNGTLWSSSEDTLFYNSGNVGVGTSEPIQKLHVNGNIRVEDTLILPGYSYQSFDSRGQLLIGERDIKMGFQNDNFGNILIGNSLYGKTVFDLQMTGNGNIGIGTDVFHETTSGTSNVCRGVFIGPFETGRDATGSKNIFIGNLVGKAWNGGNTLLIDNKNDNASPFIKGDMENDNLEINADVYIDGHIESETLNLNSLLNLNEITGYPLDPQNGDLIYMNDTIRFYNGVGWRNLW